MFVLFILQCFETLTEEEKKQPLVKRYLYSLC